MFLTIALIPSAFVLNETALAPLVTNAELDVPEAELIDRFLDAASAADLHFDHSRTDILLREVPRNNPTDAQIGAEMRGHDSLETQHMRRSPRDIRPAFRYFSHRTSTS